jgi:hypothetical protein
LADAGQLSLEAAPTAQAEGWHLRPWITVSGKRWWLSFVAKRFGSRAPELWWRT